MCVEAAAAALWSERWTCSNTWVKSGNKRVSSAAALGPALTEPLAAPTELFTGVYEAVVVLSTCVTLPADSPPGCSCK